MTEEQSDHPKITSEIKTKNPLRVEQGKRLAAISKAAKEKKMRDRILAEQNMNKDVLKENGNNTTFLIIFGAALVATAGGYYAYKNKNTLTTKVEESQPQPKGMVDHFD